MTSNFYNKTAMLALATAAIIVGVAVKGASALDFGGRSDSGEHSGDLHNHHIIWHGGGDDDADHGHGGKGGYHGGGRGSKAAAGNTGVYCPSCRGPVQIGNHPAPAGGTGPARPRPPTRNPVE